MIDLMYFMFPDNVFQIQYKYLNTPSVWHDVDCDTGTVDEKTVDMKCESNKDNVTHVRSINDIVTHVRILGPATQRLCSLYIIGGNSIIVIYIYIYIYICMYIVRYLQQHKKKECSTM